jgi:hypothetical protein
MKPYFFLVVAIVVIAFSLCTVRKIKLNIYYGMAILLILINAIQIIVGGTVFSEPVNSLQTQKLYISMI